MVKKPGCPVPASRPVGAELTPPAGEGRPPAGPRDRPAALRWAPPDRRRGLLVAGHHDLTLGSMTAYSRSATRFAKHDPDGEEQEDGLQQCHVRAPQGS